MVMNGGWFMTLLYPHCNIYQTLIGHSWWKERCICLLLWCHLMFILSGYLSLKVLTHSHILAWAEFRHVSVLNFEPLAGDRLCSALATGSGELRGDLATGGLKSWVQSLPGDSWSHICAGWCPRTVCGCALKPSWWQDTGRVASCAMYRHQLMSPSQLCWGRLCWYGGVVQEGDATRKSEWSHSNPARHVSMYRSWIIIWW